MEVKEGEERRNGAVLRGGGSRVGFIIVEARGRERGSWGSSRLEEGLSVSSCPDESSSAFVEADFCRCWCHQG